jgi:hypothetical protein
MMKRFVLTAAVTAALIAGIILLPHSQRAGTIAAADVAKALAQVSSWHVRGWKLQNGAKTPWEAHWRRSPYLYYERTGKETITDDGRVRVWLLPPDPHIQRGQGIAIRTRSHQGENTDLRFVSESSDRIRNAGDVHSQTSATVTLRIPSMGMGESRDSTTDYYYTIGRQTNLPVHYEVHRGDSRHRDRVVTEQYDVRYNEQAPVVALPAIPSGYRVFGSPGQERTGSIPRDNTTERDGLAIHLEPLAVDREGNILARISGWLGGVPLHANGDPGLSIRLDVLQDNRIVPSTPLQHDDLGRAYAQIRHEMPLLGELNGGIIVQLTPVEPLRAGDSAPRALTMSVVAGPKTYAAVTGERAIQERVLFTTDISVTAPLPTPVEHIDLAPYVALAWRRSASGTHTEPIAALGAEARSHYYGWLAGAGGNQDAATKELRWLERAAATPGLSPDYRVVLEHELARERRSMGK